jgi:hypothetical protein
VGYCERGVFQGGFRLPVLHTTPEIWVQKSSAEQGSQVGTQCHGSKERVEASVPSRHFGKPGKEFVVEDGVRDGSESSRDQAHGIECLAIHCVPRKCVSVQIRSRAGKQRSGSFVRIAALKAKVADDV